MPEWVHMIHPASKVMAGADPVLVTKEAFEQVWKPIGWRLASKATVEAALELTEPAPSTPRKSQATKKRR